MLKKISALLVLSLFLMSLVPMALADSREEGSANSRIQEQENEHVYEQEQNETSAENETHTEIESEDDSTNSTEPVREQTRLREKLNEKRVEIKEKVAEVREKVQDVREHWQDVRDKYANERKTFLEARKEYKDCTGIENEACKSRREEIKGKAKGYLGNAADLVLSEIARVKEKVQATTELTEEEKAQLISDLDTYVQKVTGAKSAVDALGENATREEINAAAKSVRDAWQEAKVVLKKSIGLIANAKLGNIVEKTQALEEKLKITRDRLEEKGKDVTKLDSILAQFNEKIKLANEKYAEARAKWIAAHTPGDVDNAAKEVHTLLEEAKDALKEARALLRDAVQEIKSLNRGTLEVKDASGSATNSSEAQTATD